MCGAIMGGVIDVRCYLQTKMMFFAGWCICLDGGVGGVTDVRWYLQWKMMFLGGWCIWWCSSVDDVFVWMGGGGVNDVRWHSTGQVGWMLLADAQKRPLTCKRITIGSAEAKIAQWVESLVNTIWKVMWSRYSNGFCEVVGARLRHGRPLLCVVCLVGWLFACLLVSLFLFVCCCCFLFVGRWWLVVGGFVGCLLVVCWLFVGCLLVVCLLFVCWLFVCLFVC